MVRSQEGCWRVWTTRMVRGQEGCLEHYVYGYGMDGLDGLGTWWRKVLEFGP